MTDLERYTLKLGMEAIEAYCKRIAELDLKARAFRASEGDVLMQFARTVGGMSFLAESVSLELGWLRKEFKIPVPSTDQTPTEPALSDSDSGTNPSSQTNENPRQ